jgi:hypothetical protein
MKRRYSIWGVEHGSDHEVELAQVDSNPQPVFLALKAKTLATNESAFGGKKKKTKMPRYTWLHIVDNGT